MGVITCVRSFLHTQESRELRKKEDEERGMRPSDGVGAGRGGHDEIEYCGGEETHGLMMMIISSHFGVLIGGGGGR